MKVSPPRSCGFVFVSSWAAALTLLAACAPGPAVGAIPAAGPSPRIGPSPSTTVAAVTVAPLAAVGDRCVARFACSTNRLTLLRCDGGKMVEHRACRGPRGCEADERSTRCDQSIAEIGDTCDDGAACSLDGLNLLVCRDGHLTLKSACTSGCEINRKRIACYGTDIAP